MDILLYLCNVRGYLHGAEGFAYAVQLKRWIWI